MSPQATNGAGPSLRRVMRATEYFTLAFGSMIGVGWMVVIDDWLARGGPVGAMTGFLLGGVVLVPVAYVYGRLAERLPQAGSEIAYTGAVFPRAVSFATGWAMTLAYVIVCPYEAVAIGRLAAYALPELDTLELYRVAGHPVYLPHLVVGVGLTGVITFLNYRGVQLSAAFQNWTTFGLLAVFFVFATLGLFRSRAENLRPFFADAGVAGGLLSTLAVMQVVPYFLLGFETVPKCSEEAAGDFDPRRFVRVILLALAAGTFFYVAVIAVVAMLQPWPELLAVSFPTAVAFERAFGWRWLVQLIMLGAVLSLFKVFNGNFLASTRLLYAMGRGDFLASRWGAVHAAYRTPTAAIVLVGALTVGGALLGRAVLVPISEVGSLACVAGWLATCLAFARGAAGAVTGRARLIGLFGAAVCAVLVVIVVRGFGVYHLLALAGWAALGGALWLRRRKYRG